MDKQTIESLAAKLTDAVPADLAAGMKGVGEDLKTNFRAVLQSSFEKMELVSREEFEVQRKVLQRTRERLEALEQQLQELDAAAKSDQDGTG